MSPLHSEAAPEQPVVTAAATPTPAAAKATAEGKPTQTVKSAPVWLDFDHLRQQLPLQRVLEHLGVSATLRGRGPQRRGRCPIHDAGGTSRTFSVHLHDNVYHCFAASCQSKGDSIDLWAAVKHLLATSARATWCSTSRSRGDSADGYRARTPSSGRPPGSSVGAGDAALHRQVGEEGTGPHDIELPDRTWPETRFLREHRRTEACRGQARRRLLQATQGLGDRSRQAALRHRSRPRRFDWPPTRSRHLLEWRTGDIDERPEVALASSCLPNCNRFSERDRLVWLGRRAARVRFWGAAASSAAASGPRQRVGWFRRRRAVWCSLVLTPEVESRGAVQRRESSGSGWNDEKKRKIFSRDGP
jgi:hypothetical protein